MVSQNRPKGIALFEMLLMAILIAPSVLRVQAQQGAPAANRYTNADYEYSIPIPENLEMIRSDECAPNHGFGIILSRTPYSYLWVDGTFYSEDYTVQEVPQVAIQLLQSRGAVKTKLRNQSRSLLGGLSAMHFLIDYELKGTPMVSETIWALRAAGKNNSATHYSINLECAKERFEQDSLVVEKLRRALRFLR
jgi:hypothetical protein